MKSILHKIIAFSLLISGSVSCMQLQFVYMGPEKKSHNQWTQSIDYNHPVIVECRKKAMEGDKHFVHQAIVNYKRIVQQLSHSKDRKQLETVQQVLGVLQGIAQDLTTEILYQIKTADLATAEMYTNQCCLDAQQDSRRTTPMSRGTYSSPIEQIAQAARAILSSRPDYQAKHSLDHKPEASASISRSDASLPPVTQKQSESIVQSTDMTMTSAGKSIDVNPEIDNLIESTLRDLHEQYSDFDQYQKVALEKLREMHKQGLLTPAIDIRREVLLNGIQHYFKSLITTNPLTHPKEFTINLIKYTALGAMHTATGGVLIPVQIAAQLASTMHHLQSIDTSHMTPNEYAEFIAEELADITYTVATTKLMNAVKNTPIPEGFIRVTRDVIKGNDPQVALAGGGSISSPSTTSSENALFAQKDSSCARRAGSLIENGKDLLTLEEIAKVEMTLNSLANGNAIKELGKEAFDVGHTFSREHLNNGILKLGNSKDDIILKFIEVIKKADESKLLMQGPNRILTKINGYEVEIRAFIRDHTLLSFNAFMGYSNRVGTSTITILHS